MQTKYICGYRSFVFIAEITKITEIETRIATTVVHFTFYTVVGVFYLVPRWYILTKIVGIST